MLKQQKLCVTITKFHRKDVLIYPFFKFILLNIGVQIVGRRNESYTIIHYIKCYLPNIIHYTCRAYMKCPNITL